MQRFSTSKLTVAITAAVFALAVPLGLTLNGEGGDPAPAGNPSPAVELETNAACAAMGGCGCIESTELCCCCGSCLGSSTCNFGCEEC